MSKNCLIFLVLGMILLLTSCARKEIAAGSEPQDVYIENVPFVKQKDKYCGPSAMASVLQFHGQYIDRDEIAGVIYIPELNAALMSDMENYAASIRYYDERTNGKLEPLE